MHLVDEGLDAGPIVLQEAVPRARRRHRRRRSPRASWRPSTASTRARCASLLEGALSRRRAGACAWWRRRERADEAFARSSTRGCVDVVTPDALQGQARAAASPLTVKVGFDPTAPDLHLGHTVLMRKMKHFQDLRPPRDLRDRRLHGHDRRPDRPSKTRPPLTREEIEANAETYKQQVFKILDPDEDRDALQPRVAGAAGLRRLRPPGRHLQRRAHAGAARLQAALRGGPADLGARVPLPAGPGLRLGGAEGRRRARRHRPALQPERRAATSCRPTASSRRWC